MQGTLVAQVSQKVYAQESASGGDLYTVAGRL